jgi:predicted HicB family RNase H-like nuclease
MFRIRKGYDSESKTFRLPIELIEKLDILAAQNKLSLNQLVIQCLIYAVDNLEADSNKKGEDEKNGNA